MIDFFAAVWNVMLELSPWLLVGAVAAGVLHVLLPEDFLRRQLSQAGGVFKAVLLGVPLPLCSCAVIPVGVSLKKGGASDGATVGFLISTPQTGVDSIFVSAGMLGWPFALFKLISAAVIGIVGGTLTDVLGEKPVSPVAAGQAPPSQRQNRLAALFGHSLELLRSIWGWLVIGIVVSAALEVFLPPSALDALASYGQLEAMFIVLLISVPLYVCATASVPIAAALVAGGLPTSAALVFLMAGPATNVATLGTVYRTLGRKPLAIYLGSVVVGSIACGWAFGSIIDASPGTAAHLHGTETWWKVASAVILLALLAVCAGQDAMRLSRRWSALRRSCGEPTLQVAVQGMTCGGCVEKLEQTLAGEATIDAAMVTLSPGSVVVHGEISEDRVRELIEQAGFRSA